MTLFGYDKVGNRQSVTRTNAAGTVFSTTGYGYDSLNRLTDIINKNASSAVVSSYHYTLRLDGKRGSVTEGGPATSGGTTGYFYDDSGKLTEEAGPYADIQYGYDNVGNRLTRTVTGSTTALLPNGVSNTTYDVNDRIVGHSYDLDGNETTVNGQAASYDFENHLVSFGSVASYVYDADGNRYSASNLGTTTSYAVDTSLPYASVVEEYTGGSTTPSARYDYGDDLVRMDRGGVYYYLYDGLGSTRQLVNTAGAVTDTWAYSAFGELASHTGSTVNPFLFNAQQFDQASGDYFLRARYYDQSNGRFISQDPFSGSNEDPISLHRYLYASVDPVDRVDPSGKDDLAEVLVSTSISEGLQGLKSSVDLEIYNTVYNDVQYGDKGAIAGFAFGLAIRFLGPVVLNGIGKGIGKLGRGLAKFGASFSRYFGEGAAVAIEGAIVRGASKYTMTIPNGEAAVEDWINETRAEFEASGGHYKQSGMIDDYEYGNYDWNENEITLHADAGLDTEMEELYHWTQARDRNLIYSGKTIPPGDSPLRTELEDEVEEHLYSYGWERTQTKGE